MSTRDSEASHCRLQWDSVNAAKVTPSVRESELLARWRAVRRADLYQVQICTADTPVPSKWELKRSPSRTNCKLNSDPVPGQRVWVRVRAIGTRGEGAWSDVGWKRVS